MFLDKEIEVEEVIVVDMEQVAVAVALALLDLMLLHNTKVAREGLEFSHPYQELLPIMPVAEVVV